MYRVLIGVISLVVCALVWQVSAEIFTISQLILPGLDQVAASVWNNGDALFSHGAYTARATLEATLFATVAAFAVAFVAASSLIVDSALSPIVVAAQALPKVVLIPLLFLVIAAPIVPGIIVGALIGFFPVYVTLRYSLDTIPQGLIDLGTVWKYGRLRFLWHVGFPFALPAAISVLRLAWLYVLIGVISAELLHPDRGIGFLLDQAQRDLNGPFFYAAALTSLAIAATGWIVCSILDQVTRRIFRMTPTMIVRA